jgi:ATP-dependent Clp protease, protease subunit
MVHQPSGGFQGQASDIMIHAKRGAGAEGTAEPDLREHRPDYDTVERALDRDNFMTAERPRPGA